MVVLSNFKGEGEDMNFHIELVDPAEPRNTEQHGLSGAADTQQTDPSGSTPGSKLSSLSCISAMTSDGSPYGCHAVHCPRE